jgi:hypothetical protein
MQIKDLEKPPLDSTFSLNFTKPDRDRWEKIKAELKQINKSVKITDEARKRLITLMDELEAMIKEYKSKNLILP